MLFRLILRTSLCDNGSADQKSNATQAKLLVTESRSPREPTNRRSTVDRWLFEAKGGHGRTLWTRRRIEDTPPSDVDPVKAPNVARGV